jgi:hypothetical protein
LKRRLQRLRQERPAFACGTVLLPLEDPLHLKPRTSCPHDQILRIYPVEEEDKVVNPKSGLVDPLTIKAASPSKDCGLGSRSTPTTGTRKDVRDLAAPTMAYPLPPEDIGLKPRLVEGGVFFTCWLHYLNHRDTLRGDWRSSAQR